MYIQLAPLCDTKNMHVCISLILFLWVALKRAVVFKTRKYLVSVGMGKEEREFGIKLAMYFLVVTDFAPIY